MKVIYGLLLITLTACANTTQSLKQIHASVKNPVLEGVFEFERHPGTTHSKPPRKYIICPIIPPCEEQPGVYEFHQSIKTNKSIGEVKQFFRESVQTSGWVPVKNSLHRFSYRDNRGRVAKMNLKIIGMDGAFGMNIYIEGDKRNVFLREMRERYINARHTK